MRLHRLLIPVVFLSLIVSGCNIPNNNQAGVKVNAIFTAAAETVEAKLTQAPLPPSQLTTPTANIPVAEPSLEPFETATEAPAQAETTATSIPTATNSPAPTQVCDAAQFLADVTYPDGTIVKTNELFTKIWRFKNIGTCTWDSSYTLVFDVGDQMGGPTSVPLAVSVAPGQEVELSVDFQAPAKSGSYRSYWRLRNPAGIMLPISSGYKNKSFYVDIRVKDNVNNFSSDREFAVSHIDFNVTHRGSCSSGIYTVAAKITVNAAGEVSYKWKRSDGTSDAFSDGKITFTSSGTQMITYDWPTAATGISVTLSVITPVEQDFGPALLNCSS